MNVITSVKHKFQNVISAASRYPLTLVLLIISAVYSAVMIETEKLDNEKLYAALLIGIFLSIVAQQFYERFFVKSIERYSLMAAALLLTLFFYLVILPEDTFVLELSIKTSVVLLALTLVYIWIPTMKNLLPFHANFLLAFRAFFITLLFTVVLIGGISFIIGAVDSLLFSVDDNFYLHVINVIATLFAPLFFLSFTPLFFGKKDISLSTEQKKVRQEQLTAATSVSKLFNGLFSYVIIPLSAVFTVILFIYLIINIRSDFWSDNLLEPLLVSYSVETIIVYVLACNLSSPIAKWYNKIIPNILIPIVLLQTVSSILKINELGMTHGRYYVILFGIFATFAGVIFSFLPVQKNSWIVPIFLALSIVSITPSIDAFTVSRNNQEERLKSTLLNNDMLEKNSIHPDSSIAKKDKQSITRAVDYLQQTDYLQTISWLPDSLTTEDNFEDVFGFPRYWDEVPGEENYPNVHFSNSGSQAIPIQDFDFFSPVYLSRFEDDSENPSDSLFSYQGKDYILITEPSDKYYQFTLYEQGKKDSAPLLSVDPEEAFSTLLEKPPGTELSLKEATLSVYESDKARMQIIVINLEASSTTSYADLYLLIDIK